MDRGELTRYQPPTFLVGSFDQFAKLIMAQQMVRSRSFWASAVAGFIAPQVYSKLAVDPKTSFNAAGKRTGTATLTHGAKFAGRWKIMTEFDDNMAMIASKLGVPSYVQRLNRLGFDTFMTVVVGSDRVVENIEKYNGWYRKEVVLLMDGLEHEEFHPIDGTLIRVKSYWYPVRKSTDGQYELADDKEVNVLGDVSSLGQMAAVTDLYYESYAQHQRVIRVLENEANMIHVNHVLQDTVKNSKRLFAHRYLERLGDE